MALLSPIRHNLGGQELLVEDYDDNFEPTEEGELCTGCQGDKDGGQACPQGSSHGSRDSSLVSMGNASSCF